MESSWLLRSGPPHAHDVEAIAELLHPYDGRPLPEIAEGIRAARQVVSAIDPRTGELFGVGWVHPDGLGFGHSADVFVAPERRGRGLGHALVRRLAASPAGATRSWLLRGAGHHALGPDSSTSPSAPATRSSDEAVSRMPRVGTRAHDPSTGHAR